MPHHKRQILKFFAQFFSLPVLIYLGVIFFPALTAQGESAPYIPVAQAPTYQKSAKVLGTSFRPAKPPANKSFATLIRSGPPLTTKPVNRQASIIIEKIAVNSPIVWDVAVADKKAYEEALESGVAHAKDTKKPGETGNSYLFAHSTRFEENIARYAAVFTKLDELEIGDRIVAFYNGKRYDYEVEDVSIVPRFDTTPLLRNFDTPKLTLQTCHPRGIPKDRLIVTAKLVGVFEG